MQLQLAIIALKSSHFDNRCLFQVNQPQLLCWKFFHILDHTSQRIDQINNVVALVEDLIDRGTCIGHLGLEAELDHVLHKIWMRLVTNFEYIFLVDVIKTGCCGLHVIKSISHITLSSEDEILKTVIGGLEIL